MRILVVDDESALRHTLSAILSNDGHAVVTAEDGEDALGKAGEAEFDIILCDIRMPKLDGLEFLSRYHDSGGKALVITMSAFSEGDNAISAMQRGAYDYIQKPFHAEQVLLVLRKAVEREKLRAEVKRLSAELTSIRGGSELVGRSVVLRAALDVARQVARHTSTVLLTGESGTGKELVARLIHDSSPRANEPFVAVNCGAIPEALLESELFGHAKGAFTGASSDKTGLFEEADGGTIMLDEIGDLPASLQVKLLRVLQEGEVRRVGSTTSGTVDVRVLAATNRDLETEVAENRFRSDLYYRVNVVTIRLPALRERPEDVPELARHFLARYNKRFGLSVQAISPAAMRLLVEFSWPGNVRELENAIERAVVLCQGELIEPSQLPDAVRSAAGARGPAGGGAGATNGDLSIKRRTETLERELIQRALTCTRGNRTQAARILDLSHRALLYKIREYGLSGKD
ncbi:MAG: sigma-54-dependent transcriptional regulator [Gemmatimonadaceae bacterium]